MIVLHPDPVLLAPTEEIQFPVYFDFRALIEEMFLEMYKKRDGGVTGIGLAANQIGVSRRVAVLGVPGWPPMVMANPIVTRAKGEDAEEEGCLSHPGKRFRVKRADKVWVDYRDEFGKKKNLAARGFLARVIQHEIDHLDGVTCMERASR